MTEETQQTPNRSLHYDKPGDALAAPKGRNYLLAIAINEYVHCGKLLNAVPDAQAFMAILKDRYQFDEEAIYTLFDGEANYEKIDSVFREISEKITPGIDNLVVYYSGHGLYDEHLDDAYWIPVDATFDRTRDYFPYDRIMRHLRATPSHHTFLIVDSCYSGSVLVREKSLGGERLERDPSRWILASGRNEVVPDGVQGENSPFARQLLDVLQRNTHEGLPVMSLIDQVTRNTLYNSRQTPIGQPLQDVGHQGGQFIFHPKEDEAADWKTTIAEGTGEAYRKFYAKWPYGKFAEQACWLLAKQVDNTAEYKQYLDRFSEGHYLAEAIEALDRCEDRDKFEAARRQGEAAMRRYLIENPKGRYIDEIQKEIERQRSSPVQPLIQQNPGVEANNANRQKLTWGLLALAVVLSGLSLTWVFFSDKKEKTIQEQAFSSDQYFTLLGDSVLNTGNGRANMDLALVFYREANNANPSVETSKKIQDLLQAITAFDDSVKMAMQADSVALKKETAVAQENLTNDMPATTSEKVVLTNQYVTQSKQALQEGDLQRAQAYNELATKVQPNSSMVQSQQQAVVEAKTLREQYDSFMAAGDKYMQSGEYKLAYNSFTEASKIKNTPEIKARIETIEKIYAARKVFRPAKGS